LHVGVLRTEEGLGALDRQRLDPVDVLTASVVALARVALGIFVVEQGAKRLQHRGAGDVLRWNQLQRVLLAFEFVADRGTDLGIDQVNTTGQVSAGLQHRLIIPESVRLPELRLRAGSEASRRSRRESSRAVQFGTVLRRARRPALRLTRR